MFILGFACLIGKNQSLAISAGAKDFEDNFGQFGLS